MNSLSQMMNFALKVDHDPVQGQSCGGRCVYSLFLAGSRFSSCDAGPLTSTGRVCDVAPG